jgi:predicted DNA-binding protein
MSTQMIIRVEPQLKDKVARLARAEGKTTSEVVRELLEDYIASRDIAASIDGLWERIGSRLTREDVTSEGVADAIREVRQGKA